MQAGTACDGTCYSGHYCAVSHCTQTDSNMLANDNKLNIKHNEIKATIL